MRFRTVFLAALSTLLLPSFAPAQITSDARAATPIAASAPTAVPALIPYASTAVAADGKPLTAETSMTFLIFKEETGGQPLWVETQMVSADTAGQYAVKLGASSPSGLPLEVFANGTARWLEVQIAGQKPQPRVLLATVPYAAKAADAATLGGLPASAFALVGSVNPGTLNNSASSQAAGPPNATSAVTTTGGNSGYVPMFTGTSTIANSQVFANSSGVGVSTTSPAATLDVNGDMIVRGPTIVARTGNATAAKGYPSNGFDFYSNAYNSSTKVADNPHFIMQSEPIGNNTASTSATFNFLYSNLGTTAETGFYINPNGTLHFATGQSFPGTVTSVGLAAPVSDFTVTGSPVTGSGAFNIAWKVPPTSSNTASAIVKRDSSGGFTASAIIANSLESSGSLSGSTLAVYGQAYLAAQVGIGTNTPAAQLNLNANNAANADALLLGNTSSKGLQLRDNGTGVDIESIGVPLNVNFLTQQPTYINPNGGTVVIGDSSTQASIQGVPLYVGAISNDGGKTFQSAEFDGDSSFFGEVYVSGALNVEDGLYVSGTKDFRIDHPVDPENKYLFHAAIESSEVLNQYSGNVATDELGLATVQLPDWFEVENTDFRYQLTVIGGRFAQAVISKEVEHNQFTINTSAPGVKVSWQVTAKRNDPYMKAHPFVVEQQKTARERGTYIHPELFGQPESKRTGGVRRLSTKQPSR